jgi:hypothetical protein
MLLFEGTYQGEIIEHRLGFSTQKKTPQIEFTVQLTHLEGQPLDKPQRRQVMVYLSSNSTESAYKTLRGLGFPGGVKDVKQLKEHNFSGFPCEVQIEHEAAVTKRGEDYTREKLQFKTVSPDLTAAEEARFFEKVGEHWVKAVAKAEGEEIPEDDPFGTESAEVTSRAVA